MMPVRMLDGWSRGTIHVYGGVNACVMHHCMSGVVRMKVERLEKCNTAGICSVRVDGRVALRGICGRVRGTGMHELSGEICTVLHAGCDGEVSCMCV
jgi:hypothetical protein